ncbi:hypothetical protein [Streptomyces sp. VNUA24]|uniref:hypothetical protein n=1 Tax=Streptomyces sp. VNUA24 TaxID=3031131 RepID=UPI0023B7E500|nr:hypothetical protein [Streptomyces sp. VNUA24]WEH15301.1 hypothetical protein PYR72_16875 [Streptomyces sp. VNUA24]
MAAIIISAIAVTLSLVSLFLSRRKDQRDNFLKLHELLISPELQNGRRVLFELYAQGSRVEDLDAADYASANRALAAFDVAGLYCHKKYVKEGEILDLWAPSLTRTKYAAVPFIQHRDAFWSGVPTWPHYRRLADRAEEHLKTQGVDIDQFIVPRPSLPPNPADPS